MLTTFEHIQELTAKERCQLDWMLIELQARHPLGHEWNRVTIRHASSHRMHQRGGDWTDYPGLRGVQVRKMIQALRDEGYPIGSNGKGYYYAHIPSDWDPTIKHLQERHNRLTQTLDQCKAAKRGMAIEAKTLDAFQSTKKAELPAGTKIRIVKPLSSYNGMIGQIAFKRSDGGYTVKVKHKVRSNDLVAKEFMIPQLLESEMEIINAEAPKS